VCSITLTFILSHLFFFARTCLVCLQRGLGVEQSAEAAAFYYAAAAEASHNLFHQTGRQPSNEMNRLRDGEEAAVGDGQRGSDDAQLRWLVSQAEEARHPPAMAQVAHLAYWGHRGFGRDQARARRLWDAAARLGDAWDASAAADDPFAAESTASRVAAAGMWLKGEGGEVKRGSLARRERNPHTLHLSLDSLIIFFF
jgi:TPR repeat protein